MLGRKNRVRALDLPCRLIDLRHGSVMRHICRVSGGTISSMGVFLHYLPRGLWMGKPHLLLRQERSRIEIGNFLEARSLHTKDWRRQRVTLDPGFIMLDDQRPGRQIFDNVPASSLLATLGRRDRFTLLPHF